MANVTLSGMWNNLGPDGGTCQVLQVGNTETNGQAVLFSRGQNPKAGWSNVGYGTVDMNSKTVTLWWADPDGSNRGNHGQTFFQYVDNNNLKKLAGSGWGDFKRQGT